MTMRHLTASVPFLLAFTSLLDAQLPTAVPAIPPQVVQNASQSLALVLAGRTRVSSPVLVGPAIVAREDGVLLTPYHVLKDADSLQVRLNNGDVFNDAQLLGVDAQRDVAAIKIGAVGLHPLTLGDLAQARLGTPVVVIAHTSGPSWNASIGQISAYRSAEPAANGSLDVLQFTPSLPRTSSGGVLLDRQGQAFALITSAQTPSAAVPLEKVLNLADGAPSRKFANGRTLIVPGAILTSAQVVNQPQTVATPDAPEKSDALSSSADRDALLRSVKTA
jgi:S1-C subfamily serine protease